jgi:hypothetical protein
VLRCSPEQARLLTRSELVGEQAVDEIRVEMRNAMGKLSESRDIQRGFTDLTNEEHPKAGEPAAAPRDPSIAPDQPAEQEETSIAPDPQPAAAPVDASNAEPPSLAEEDTGEEPREVILDTLRSLKKTKWANQREVAAVSRLLPGSTIDAVKFSYQPKRWITPRPYLEADKGHFRKSVVLKEDNDLVETATERWTANVDESHETMSMKAKSMLTIFTREGDLPEIKLSPEAEGTKDAQDEEEQGQKRKRVEQEEPPKDGEPEMKKAEAGKTGEPVGFTKKEVTDWRMFPQKGTPAADLIYSIFHSVGLE